MELSRRPRRDDRGEADVDVQADLIVDHAATIDAVAVGDGPLGRCHPTRPRTTPTVSHTVSAFGSSTAARPGTGRQPIGIVVNVTA